MICSWLEQIALKKRAIRSKKIVFFVCFLQFFSTVSPFLNPRAKCSRCSFLKSDGSDWLFTKEWLWANRSRHSLKKATVSDGSDLLFLTSKSLFRLQKTSYLLKKPMIKFPTLKKGQQNVPILKKTTGRDGYHLLFRHGLLKLRALWGPAGGDSIQKDCANME